MHRCAPGCECRSDLNRAAEGLAAPSRMLSDSVSTGNDELIETYYAFFRAARAKFCGARAAWLDQYGEAAPAGEQPTLAA